MVLGILVTAYVLVIGPLVAKTATHPGLAGIQAFWSLLTSSVISLGIIMIIFALVQFRSQRTSFDWDARRLPPVSATPNDHLDPMPWYRASTGIAVSVLFALAWVYLTQPQTAAHFEGVRIGLTPIWRSLFWPTLVVLLGGAVRGAAGLLRPNAVRLHIAGKMGHPLFVLSSLFMGVHILPLQPSPMAAPPDTSDVAWDKNDNTWVSKSSKSFSSLDEFSRGRQTDDATVAVLLAH